MAFKGIQRFWLGAAFVTGLFLGWTIFRLPEPACGPFRWDKAPEWMGVIIAASAAYATFWAIRVGLHSAEKAVASERGLRDRERQDVKEDRQRQARIVAGVAFGSLTDCLGQLLEIAECYGDGRFRDRQNDLMQIIANIRHHAIDDIAGRPDLFDPEDGIAFGVAKVALEHTVLIATKNSTQFAKWDAKLKLHMWKESPESLTYTINALKQALVRAGSLSHKAIDFSAIEKFAKECAQRRAAFMFH